MMKSLSLKCGYAAVLLGFALNGTVVAGDSEPAMASATRVGENKPEQPAVEAQAVAHTTNQNSSKDIILAPTASPTPSAAPLGGATPTSSSVNTATLPQEVSNQGGADARQISFGGSLANFGLHLLRSQTSESGNANQNAIISPYSAANALGMLHAGAAGQTATEIARLFESSGSNGRLLRKQMKRANAALSKPAEGVELTYANRVWLDASVVQEVLPVFKATVADIYRGDGVVVPLSNGESAAKTINQWVAENTKGKITQLLTPAALQGTTKAVVTNAVYFKGHWKTAFDPAATKNLPFYAKPDSPKAVPTMSGTLALRTGESEGLRVYELPYGNGDYVMLIALPVDPRHTVDAMEQDTDGSDIISWFQALKPTTVQLQLPKFHIDPVARSLKSALISDGMKSAFDNSADFSALAGKVPLVVNDVIQAAGIVVDEQGAEATAATAVVMRSKSIGALAVPPLHKIDRPFMFVLAHKPTATPLFIGKIVQPE